MQITSTRTVSSSQKYRLILLSFLMLFVELVLIRWSQANVLYLAYFSNFVLLGSFLGIGIGFIYKNNSLYKFAPLMLLGFIVFINKYSVHIEISEKDLFDKFLIFSKCHVSGLSPWFTLPFIFLMTAMTMACIANGVAEAFSDFNSLEAYRLDILGSIIGIFTFFILSFMYSPPIIWAFIIFLLFSFLLIDQWRKMDFIALIQIGCLLILIVIAAQDSFKPNVFWSPYSKITLRNIGEKKYLINTNGIPYQLMEPSVVRHQLEPLYWAPYQHRIDRMPPEKVLIIGAGTGSDVAVALAEGAKSVDAVEIDPVIYQLGKQHPDHPYKNPRVHMIIDDGRSFLQRTHELYDLIIFALPDSHVLLSGQSSLRLESYLLTKEAIEAVKNHLKQNGLFSAYNYYLQPWIVDRLANTLYEVFNKIPCVDTSNSKESALTISTNQNALYCTSYWQPKNKLYTLPATDDHPFFYLKKNSIPIAYQIMLGLMLLLTMIVLTFIQGANRSIKDNLDLFFLGVAFLLLETKSIAIFSLLFGATWIVNALVFIGILFSVCIAIELNRYSSRISLYLLYLLLGLSLLVAWCIPINSLLSLSKMTRFFVAIILTFSPIMIANLIFAKRFQYTYKSTAAFGANLVGAMFGGVLEYSALIFGFRNLLIIIALLYVAAFLFANLYITRYQK